MNPIGPNELGELPSPMPHEGDPFKRMERILGDDMARIDIRVRVQTLIDAFETKYGYLPEWARVSFDLLHASGPAVYREGDKVCGLYFRILLEERNRVEVGISLLEDKSGKK